MATKRAATKRWILLLLLAAILFVLAGCSSGTANVQNPQPPPPPQISIAFQPEPGASLAVGFSENLTAVVTGDSNNYGVDWSLTCQNPPNCGALTVNGASATHTASGAPITYTAPATLSTNAMSVEIVAYATASDDLKNVVAPITISTFDSGLQAGNYVLQAQGVENSTPYQFAAVIKLDGQGNIIGGEQTANANGVSVTDQNLSGSYFIGSDSRGTITIVDPDQAIGTEIFSFVFLTNSQNPQALISQTGIDNTGATATGTLDLQTSTAAPSGSYAFVVNGTDVLDNSIPLAFGGVLDIPSGQTAISGVTDEIIAGSLKLSDGAFSSGSNVSAPDTFGQVTFTLLGLVSASHPKPITVLIAGYIVDATHIRLIETDAVASNPAPFGATGGLALGQAAGTYGNFNNESFSGTYVFGVTGVDLSPINSSYIPTTLTSAALFTADGSGDLTNGFTDIFLQQNCVQLTCTQSEGATPGAQISASFTGAYSVDAAGTGRTTLNSFAFSPAPNPSYSPTLFFYLTGNGSQGPAALVLAAGDLGSEPKKHYPSVGTGVAYGQSTATAAFSGPYGFSFTQVGSSGENDGTAQMNANPTASPQVSGLADSATTPSNDPTLSDHVFTGSFAPAQSNSAFAGGFFNAPTNGGPFNANSNNTSNGFTVDYYFIDPGHGFFVETDLVTPSPGSEQVSFGYYAARTPVCDGCP